MVDEDAKQRLRRIKNDIAEIAQRPNNVRLSEMERIVNQLRLAGYAVQEDRTAHGMMYMVGSARSFMVCAHHPGSSQVKSYGVKHFLAAMAELNLYGDGDDDE
jgi:hypothetical protein